MGDPKPNARATSWIPFPRAWSVVVGRVVAALPQFPAPLVAGGRYDGLLARLGSAKPVPAVGFAVWIERLCALGGPA